MQSCPGFVRAQRERELHILPAKEHCFHTCAFGLCTQSIPFQHSLYYFIKKIDLGLKNTLVFYRISWDPQTLLAFDRLHWAGEHTSI